MFKSFEQIFDDQGEKHLCWKLWETLPEYRASPSSRETHEGHSSIQKSKIEQMNFTLQLKLHTASADRHVKRSNHLPYWFKNQPSYQTFKQSAREKKQSNRPFDPDCILVSWLYVAWIWDLFVLVYSSSQLSKKCKQSVSSEKFFIDGTFPSFHITVTVSLKAASSTTSESYFALVSTLYWLQSFRKSALQQFLRMPTEVTSFSGHACFYFETRASDHCNKRKWLLFLCDCSYDCFVLLLLGVFFMNILFVKALTLVYMM